MSEQIKNINKQGNYFKANSFLASLAMHLLYISLPIMLIGSFLYKASEQCPDVNRLDKKAQALQADQPENSTETMLLKPRFCPIIDLPALQGLFKVSLLDSL